MTILHKHPGKYDGGAYGIVFFDDQGYAIKVFKRRAEAPEDHLKKVFTAEVDAYQIASKHQQLRGLVPQFFGPVQCAQILDASGKDISHQFHLSLAYKMRKVDGNFRKCGVQDPELKTAFRDAGIHHTKDASVLFAGDGSTSCVVDIATQEHELWHQ
jgi:hypothetical protein